MKLKTITQNALWQSLIGKEVGRDTVVDGHIRRRKLKEQSEQIAKRLSSVGVDLFDVSRPVYEVGLCSGYVELKAVSYRNSNLIPEVQSRNVHRMLRELQCFMDSQDAKKQRMLTISEGWVPLMQYNETHRSFCRRLSRFFAKPEVKAYGIEAQFFNVENTIHRRDDGAHLNVHSHTLIKSNRYLGAKRWQEFMDLAKRYFGKGYVHDSPLKNAAEVVKYVFKPSEFEKLEDWELAFLAVQCHRLKFFHPVGKFRDWRRQLVEDKVTVKRIPSGKKWKWVAVEKGKRSETKNNGAPPPAGRVIAITAPSPRFTARMEPVFIVQGFRGDIDQLATQNGVMGLLERARELWSAAENADILSIKDTTTTTVREKVPPNWRNLPGDGEFNHPSPGQLN